MQPVAVAVPVFEAEVEQLGVEIVKQLYGGGGVERACRVQLRPEPSLASNR